MERRSKFPFRAIPAEWQEALRVAAASAGATLSTTDGRWALLSTSLTAIVAGSIAWLAAGTVTPVGAKGFGTGHEKTLLPYQLFLKLAQSGRGT